MPALRCPECRTRRADPHLMALHVLNCPRPLCTCGSYTYPHRPMAGLCTLNPDAQVTLAARAGTPKHELLDVAIEVALSMRGKPLKAWPFDSGRTWMRESVIEKHLVKRVKELGGEVRKVQWIGRRGAPDRLVMLPSTFVSNFWVELKAPGKKAEAHQSREHNRMRRLGERVEVIDSIEAVESLLARA